jgi:hypothetical protein
VAVNLKAAVQVSSTPRYLIELGPGLVDAASLGETKESTMPKIRPPNPPQLRARLHELARSGRPPRSSGRQLEPSAQRIRHWLKWADYPSLILIQIDESDATVSVHAIPHLCCSLRRNSRSRGGGAVGERGGQGEC